MQKFCLETNDCIKAHADYAKAEKKKADKKKWSNEKKALKEDLQTLQDLLKICQVTCNTYVRLRDKNKHCISCEKPLGSKYDAGHFYSVGSTPELRFNLDNIHAQCVHCNQHLHGNLIEYSENLPLRIGEKRFNELRKIKGTVVKYTKEEVKELIKKFRALIKEIKE